MALLAPLSLGMPGVVEDPATVGLESERQVGLEVAGTRPAEAESLGLPASGEKTARSQTPQFKRSLGMRIADALVGAGAALQGREAQVLPSDRAMARFQAQKEEEINRRAQAQRAAVLAPKLAQPYLDKWAATKDPEEKKRFKAKAIKSLGSLLPSVDFQGIFARYSDRRDVFQNLGEAIQDPQVQDMIAQGAPNSMVESYITKQETQQHYQRVRTVRLAEQAQAKVRKSARWLLKNDPQTMRQLTGVLDLEDIERVQRMLPDELRLTPQELVAVQDPTGEEIFASAFGPDNYLTKAEKEAREEEARGRRRSPWVIWELPEGGTETVRRDDPRAKELAARGAKPVSPTQKRIEVTLQPSTIAQYQKRQGDARLLYNQSNSLYDRVEGMDESSFGFAGGVRRTAAGALFQVGAFGLLMAQIKGSLAETLSKGELYSATENRALSVADLAREAGVKIFDPNAPKEKVASFLLAFAAVRASTGGRVAIEGVRTLHREMGGHRMFGSKQAMLSGLDGLREHARIAYQSATQSLQDYQSVVHDLGGPAPAPTEETWTPEDAQKAARELADLAKGTGQQEQITAEYQSLLRSIAAASPGWTETRVQIEAIKRLKERYSGGP